MTRFTYIARNDRGLLTRGELVAPSRLAAHTLLKRRGTRPVSIAPIADGLTGLGRLRTISWRDALGPRSYDAEIALQQLALMNRSGLGLVAALQSVGEQTKSKLFQRILGSMVDDLQDGKSLHSAISKHLVFPRVLSPLIEVGESTGKLADVLEQGAKTMSQHRKSRTALLSMLAYPLVVTIAASSVSVYLLLVVIPKLQTFLTAMGRPLPAMTQSLLNFSQAMQSCAPTIVLMFFSFLVGTYTTYRHPRGRLWLDRLALCIPFLGAILRLSGTITFSSTLGTMLRSGVPLVDALSAIENLHRNRHLAITVASIRQAVIRGQSLTAPLSRTSAYMPMLAQMMAIAERTGKTTEILEQVTKFHEEQLLTATKRLGAMLEPLLIVFIGGFVGYVYIAFFIALMSAGGSGR